MKEAFLAVLIALLMITIFCSCSDPRPNTGYVLSEHSVFCHLFQDLPMVDQLIAAKDKKALTELFKSGRCQATGKEVVPVYFISYYNGYAEIGFPETTSTRYTHPKNLKKIVNQK
jgi:hypothetical protein